MFNRLPTEILNIIFKRMSFQDVFNFYIASNHDRASKNSANYYLQRNFLFNEEKGMLDFDLLFPLIEDLGGRRRSSDNADEEMTSTTTTMVEAAAAAAEVFLIYSKFVREGAVIFSETPEYKRARTVKLTLSKYNSAVEGEDCADDETSHIIGGGVEILQTLDCAYTDTNNTLIVSMDGCYKPLIKMLREIEKEQRPLTNIKILDIYKTNNNNNNNDSSSGSNFSEEEEEEDDDYGYDFIKIMKGISINLPELRDVKIRCKCTLYHRQKFYNQFTTNATTNTNTTTTTNTTSTTTELNRDDDDDDDDDDVDNDDEKRRPRYLRTSLCFLRHCSSRRRCRCRNSPQSRNRFQFFLRNFDDIDILSDHRRDFRYFSNSGGGGSNSHRRLSSRSPISSTISEISVYRHRSPLKRNPFPFNLRNVSFNRYPSNSERNHLFSLIGRSINNVSSSSSSSSSSRNSSNISGNHIHESLKRYSFSNLKALYVDINDIETLMKFPPLPSSSSNPQSLEKIGIRLNHYHQHHHFASTVIDSDQLISLVSEVFDKVTTIELNLIFSWEEEKLFPAFLSLPRIIRKCDKFPWICDPKKDCSNKKNLDTLIIAIEIDGKRVREWTFKEKKINNDNEDEEKYWCPDDDDDDDDVEMLKDYNFYLKYGNFELLAESLNNIDNTTTKTNNKLEIEVPACLLCYMIHAAIEVIWHYFFTNMCVCSMCYCSHRVTPLERDIDYFRDIAAFRKGVLQETTKGGFFEFRIPSSCALNRILSRNINFKKNNNNNNDNSSSRSSGISIHGKGRRSLFSSFQFEEVRHLKLIFDLSYMKKRPSNDICECGDYYTSSSSSDENLPITFHEMNYNGFDLACSKESPTIYSFCQCNYIVTKIAKTFPNLESLEIRRDNCPPLFYKDFTCAGCLLEEEEEEEEEREGGEGGEGNPPRIRRWGMMEKLGFEKLRELKADCVNKLTSICEVSPNLERVIISLEDDTIKISNICDFLVENLSLKCIEFNFDHYLQNKKLFRIERRNYHCCWLGGEGVGGEWSNNRSLDIVISLTDDDERLKKNPSLTSWKIRVKENRSEYIRSRGKKLYGIMDQHKFFNEDALRVYLENPPANSLSKTFNILCPYFNHHEFVANIFEILQKKIRDKI